MGRVGEGREVLSTHGTRALYDYVGARAARLDGQSRAWVLARVIDFWLRCGAPPLSPLDAMLPDLPPPPAIVPPEWPGTHLAVAESPAPYGAAPAPQKKSPRPPRLPRPASPLPLPPAAG